jgi:hypothetical protein
MTTFLAKLRALDDGDRSGLINLVADRFEAVERPGAGR